MKNNIDFISMDEFTLKWLNEKLKASPPEALSAGELQIALSDLTEGKIRSLMIESGEAFVPSSLEIHCGELHILPAARRVIRGDKEIMLTPKEFDILLFLAKNRGEVFTKEQIYQAV